MDLTEKMRVLQVIKDQRNRLKDDNLSSEERIILLEWIEELEEKLSE